VLEKTFNKFFQNLAASLIKQRFILKNDWKNPNMIKLPLNLELFFIKHVAF